MTAAQHVIELAGPQLWPSWRKWTIVTLITFSLSLDVFATLSITPAAPAVLKSYNISSTLYLVWLVSIWELGEGVGGLISAPCSEMFGRYWIYHGGNATFCLFLVGGALSQNIGSFLAFRFLCGLSSTALTIGPAIVGDIFTESQRARALALNSFMPLPFAALAPTFGGFIAQTHGWRASIWIIAIISAVFTIAALPVLRETYLPVLKRRETPSNTASPKLQWSILRPIHMLQHYPLAIVTFTTAVIYGCNCLTLTTLSIVMQQQYRFSEGQTGLCFLAATIGCVLNSIAYAALANRSAKAFAKSFPGPVARLPPLILSCILLAGGLMLYGWAVHLQEHWIIPLIGIAVLSIGTCLSSVSAQNFLVDMYNEHSASALGVGVALRAFSGAFLPLVAGPLFSRLGWGWGNTLLGFVGLLPAPFLYAIMLYSRKGYRETAADVDASADHGFIR